MKKVKIMLAAIAVLAVVGGALAFKTKTPGWYLYTCDKNQNICVLADLILFTIDGNLEFPCGTITAVPPQNNDCNLDQCTSTTTGSTEVY